jgi:hypothetical protein
MSRGILLKYWNFYNVNFVQFKLRYWKRTNFVDKLINQFLHFQKIRIKIEMEHDDFYDKLPFTLTEEQTRPEYVIFGTGLQ